MYFQKTRTVCGLFCVALLAAVGMAQVGLADESISAEGRTSIEVKPTKAWMCMTLTGEGLDMAAALNDLNIRFREASKKLESLGAEKGSTQLSAPSVAAEPNIGHPVATTTVWSTSSSSATPVMVPAPATTSSGYSAAPSVGPVVPGPTSGATPVQIKKLHRVKATLSTRWKLPSGDPQKVLLFVTKLTERLETADLLGEKNAAARKEKLSPEEQEILEEMQGQQSTGLQPSYPVPVVVNQTPKSRFTFAYTGEVTLEQRREMLHKAFERARQNAEELATAARIRLGSLDKLHESYYPQVYRTSYCMPVSGDRPSLEGVIKKYKQKESNRCIIVTGITPHGLSYGVEVNAAFGIRR